MMEMKEAENDNRTVMCCADLSDTMARGIGCSYIVIDQPNKQRAGVLAAMVIDVMPTTISRVESGKSVCEVCSVAYPAYLILHIRFRYITEDDTGRR